jgi:hypothetical protein
MRDRRGRGRSGNNLRIIKRQEVNSAGGGESFRPHFIFLLPNRDGRLLMRAVSTSLPFLLAINVCFATGVALIARAIWLWGAVEVRGDAGEVLFLTLLGVVWLVVSRKLFFWLGLSVRDDAVERRNPSALIGLCGATISVAIVFAAGNLGEGPSYSNNIFSAALGTIGWLGLWLLLELAARVSVSIAEERDLASGIRLCGFLLATGLICARAVAGDWHSESATVRDFFHDGWPAFCLSVFAVFLERCLRPRRERPFPGWNISGLLPAVAYLALAVAWVWHLGRWEGMPR